MFAPLSQDEIIRHLGDLSESLGSLFCPQKNTKFLSLEIVTTYNENGLHCFISLPLYYKFLSQGKDLIFPQSPLCCCNINAEFLIAPFWSQLFLSVLVAFVCIRFPCKPGKVALLKDGSSQQWKKVLNGVGEHPASKGKSYLFWKDSENNFIFTSALEKEQKAEEIKKKSLLKTH